MSAHMVLLAPAVDFDKESNLRPVPLCIIELHNTDQLGDKQHPGPPPWIAHTDN